MSSKSALSTVVLFALALGACATGSESESDEQERSDDELEVVREPGYLQQPFVRAIVTESELPACVSIGAWCADGGDGECCRFRNDAGQLSEQAVCYSCAAPAAESPESCERDEDCGDRPGALCVGEHTGEGTCMQLCGGFAGFDCDEGSVCVYPSDGFGIGDAIGVCSPALPIEEPMCPMILMPVCGEDGEDYSNPCWAGTHGVAVAHLGSCHEPPLRERPALPHPIVQDI